MHEAGFVHRDLKPANVMWLPRENRWTVIDFGCAARIGSTAPLSFTLAYAAPEVARAFEMGTKNIESTPALDAWSLGVMAFELLTGSAAFRLVTDGRSRVRWMSVLSFEPHSLWPSLSSGKTQERICCTVGFSVTFLSITLCAASGDGAATRSGSFAVGGRVVSQATTGPGGVQGAGAAVAAPLSRAAPEHAAVPGCLLPPGFWEQLHPRIKS
jgi:serine/threonine protein kinase